MQESMTELQRVKSAEEILQSLSIRLASHSNPTAETASYYGFNHIETPSFSREDRALAKVLLTAITTHNKENKGFVAAPEERITLLRKYNEKRDENTDPLLISYQSGGKSRKGTSKHGHINLDILGSDRSISEALVIAAAATILRDDGFTKIFIDINNIGDRETNNRFEHELISYYRKYLSDLPATCRQSFKENCRAPFCCQTHDKCQALHEEAPKAINFLSDYGRHHLKEVLEYLEHFEIPYRINHTLMGPSEYSSHTIFEIRGGNPENESAEILASGGRFHSLSRALGFRKDLPIVGISLLYNRSAAARRRRRKKIFAPLLYVIHIGFEAKLQSFNIIESLHQAGIPLYHSLTRDKLIGQMAVAEQLHLPYVLIVGQKEALEGTVMVRDMSTRSQDTVSIPHLVSYLKKVLPK